MPHSRNSRNGMYRGKKVMREQDGRTSTLSPEDWNALPPGVRGFLQLRGIRPPEQEQEIAIKEDE